MLMATSFLLKRDRARISALFSGLAATLVAWTVAAAFAPERLGSLAWIQDFSSNKPRTVIFTSGDDAEAKQLVIELVNSTGLVAIDLGSLATGGAMHEVGAPLSGLDLHFVRRLR
jgi:predicted dinucleotide-binding enzyme